MYLFVQLTSSVNLTYGMALNVKVRQPNNLILGVGHFPDSKPQHFKLQVFEFHRIKLMMLWSQEFWYYLYRIKILENHNQIRFNGFHQDGKGGDGLVDYQKNVMFYLTVLTSSLQSLGPATNGQGPGPQTWRGFFRH